MPALQFMILNLAILWGLLAAFWLVVWACQAVSRGSSPAQATAPTPGAAHLLSIDGLRGVLALSVFVGHAAGARMWYRTGQWGAEVGPVFGQVGVYAVTMFFFITGFLFWEKLLRNPKPNIGAHLKSRLL